jgi:hypothetical protein
LKELFSVDLPRGGEQVVKIFKGKTFGTRFLTVSVMAATLVGVSLSLLAKSWGAYSMGIAPTGQYATKVHREQLFSSRFRQIHALNSLSIFKNRQYIVGDTAKAIWPQGGNELYQAEGDMRLTGSVLFSHAWIEFDWDNPFDGGVVASGSDYEEDCYGSQWDEREEFDSQVDSCLLSPLVLDLGRNGFKLSKPGRGVYFDLLADGNPILMQWTRKNTDDGFLVLDLNMNGLIDNGSELFGHGTTIIETSEKALDGFQALAQYDLAALGGDGNGKLSPSDAVWGNLSVWIDSNRDGFSQDTELSSLVGHGIKKISLKVRDGDEDPDRAGNVIPIWSWVTTEYTPDLPNKLKMGDVFFRRIN